jgi:electron transfer flavoprotein alpha subunit/transcriptional regulator with XRE-family HTH domain
MSSRGSAGVWVFCDIRSRRFFEYSLNVLSGAREMAGSLSVETGAVLVGAAGIPGEPGAPGDPGAIKDPVPVALDEAMASAAEHGADRILVHEHADLARPRAEVYARLISGTVEQKSPKLMLFPLTDFTRELAAMCARLCEGGLIADCVAFSVDADRISAFCPSWGGEIMAELTFTDLSKTGFITVQPHAFKAEKAEGAKGRVETVSVENPERHAKILLLSTSPEPVEHRKLEEAEIVVAGGAGLGSMEGFGKIRELAAVMGAEVGATRPPILQHWVDEDRLIGQTGKTIRPKLLVSVGTSGAVQYTAGIAEAETIVAINRDENAPIFQMADVGIVDDIKSFLPVFIEKVKKVVMRDLADHLARGTGPEGDGGFAGKMQKLREASGWSLEALAEKTGQSPEFIQKVEQGEEVPSVGFLLRLARALDVDPGTFLHTGEKEAMKDRRAREFIKRTDNYFYQTLTPGAENEHLRAFLITIEPRQVHKPVAYKHEGEEFVFVMEGTLELTLENKPHHLKPGESIRFNSEVPHMLKSTATDTTRCLVVLYTP